MRPPFRYYGAKGRLAPWIASLLPAHRAEVEVQRPTTNRRGATGDYATEVLWSNRALALPEVAPTLFEGAAA